MSDDGAAVRLTNRVATAFAAVAGVVLLALMVVTSLDVAGRYFLNRPIEGVFDLTQLAVVVIAFFGLAYCAAQDGHVTIEVLFNLFGKSTQRVLNRIINLAGAALMILIAWRTMVESTDSRELGETSNLLLIPFFPFFWVVAAGSFLFALALLLRVFIPVSKVDSDT